MSDPKYSHIGSKDDKVIEECSELIKAICKAKRFGIDDHHPVKLKTNRQQILEEMKDVEDRIREYRTEIEANFPSKGSKCECVCHSNKLNDSECPFCKPKDSEAVDEREEKIQLLLRHAFACLKDNPCSCSKQIQKFLQTDSKSLEWKDDSLRQERERGKV